MALTQAGVRAAWGWRQQDSSNNAARETRAVTPKAQLRVTACIGSHAAPYVHHTTAGVGPQLTGPHADSRHPDLFKPSTTPETPDELDPAGRMAIVLMEAPSYPTTASQLTSLNDLSLPPTETFTSLVALQPRMMELAERQYKQAMEVAELRKKSVVLIMRWHEVSILGQGRCWAEWDTRLRKAERTIRREEFRRGREEGPEITVVDDQ